MRHLSILLLFIIAALPLQAQGNESIGVVRTVTGSAMVIRGDKEISAKKDMAILQKDAIETGENGSIGIIFKDNTVFSMGPDSAIEIQDFVYDSAKFKGSMTVKMKRGTLTAVTGDIPKSSPEALRIKTPTAVLAVRGTRFAVRIIPDN